MSLRDKTVERVSVGPNQEVGKILLGVWCAAIALAAVMVILNKTLGIEILPK